MSRFVSGGIGHAGANAMSVFIARSRAGSRSAASRTKSPMDLRPPPARAGWLRTARAHVIRHRYVGGEGSAEFLQDLAPRRDGFEEAPVRGLEDDPRRVERHLVLERRELPARGLEARRARARPCPPGTRPSRARRGGRASGRRPRSTPTRRGARAPRSRGVARARTPSCEPRRAPGDEVERRNLESLLPRDEERARGVEVRVRMANTRCGRELSGVLLWSARPS